LEPNAVVVVVATRWHQDDLIGRIIANDEKHEWTVLNIPAIAMKDDALGRVEGAPLWPSRFEDDPDYENRKNSMSPYWWSAMFQGTPTPEGGGELLRDWWRFYVTQPEQYDQMCQTWDFSLKDNESSDYTVGLLLGRKGASIYVLDRVRGHFSLQQAQAHIKRWAALYPQARAKLIEDTAMGPAIKQTLQHEIGGIIPLPAKGSKVSRVKAVAPYVQAGNILLPENESGSKPKWVWEFIEECAAFPKGTNDDQVDAFTQGVTFLTPGGWRDMKNAAREAEANQPIDLMKQQTEWFKRHVEKWKKKADRKFNTKPLTKLGTRLN
jgi:predicted phage terminase large subunit-like protein